MMIKEGGGNKYTGDDYKEVVSFLSKNETNKSQKNLQS